MPYSQETVHIGELSYDAPDVAEELFQIQRETFDRCIILGPALLMGVGDTVLNRCTIERPNGVTATIAMQVTRGVVPYGAILLRDCAFHGCIFRRITFAGPEEAVRMFGSLPST